MQEGGFFSFLFFSFVRAFLLFRPRPTAISPCTLPLFRALPVKKCIFQGTFFAQKCILQDTFSWPNYEKTWFFSPFNLI